MSSSSGLDFSDSVALIFYFAYNYLRNKVGRSIPKSRIPLVPISVEITAHNLMRRNVGPNASAWLPVKFASRNRNPAAIISFLKLHNTSPWAQVRQAFSAVFVLYSYVTEEYPYLSIEDHPILLLLEDVNKNYFALARDTKRHENALSGHCNTRNSTSRSRKLLWSDILDRRQLLFWNSAERLCETLKENKNREESYLPPSSSPSTPSPPRTPDQHRFDSISPVPNPVPNWLDEDENEFVTEEQLSDIFGIRSISRSISPAPGPSRKRKALGELENVALNARPQKRLRSKSTISSPRLAFASPAPTLSSLPPSSPPATPSTILSGIPPSSPPDFSSPPPQNREQEIMDEAANEDAFFSKWEKMAENYENGDRSFSARMMNDIMREESQRLILNNRINAFRATLTSRFWFSEGQQYPDQFFFQETDRFSDHEPVSEFQGEEGVFTEEEVDRLFHDPLPTITHCHHDEEMEYEISSDNGETFHPAYTIFENATIRTRFEQSGSLWIPARPSEYNTLIQNLSIF